MNDTNRDQIEFWNKLGQRWATHQESLDLVWRPAGDAAIERAAVIAGERVIDVGCGCGATAVELAAKVGPQGSVLGIDVSEPMLARARERARALGVDHLKFVQADAASWAFEGRADLVFSRLGVMFFRDPVAAFANLRRALRPAGRLVFVCFRERALNPVWSVPLAAAATVVAPEPPTPPDEPGPFFFADESRLRTVLDGSGFIDAVCEPVDLDLVVGGDVYSAADFLVNAGAAARVVANAGDDARLRVHTAIRQSLARHLSPKGVTLGAAFWIVRATNPAAAGKSGTG